MIPSPDERPTMTVDEVAAAIGVSRDAIYDAVRDGTFGIPVLRVGRRIVVPTSALRSALHLDLRESAAPTQRGTFLTDLDHRQVPEDLREG